MKEPINRIISDLEILLGVELLEYHDKNFLSGDNASRSKERTKLIRHVIEQVSYLDSEETTPSNTDYQGLKGVATGACELLQKIKRGDEVSKEELDKRIDLLSMWGAHP